MWNCGRQQILSLRNETRNLSQGVTHSRLSARFFGRGGGRRGMRGDLLRNIRTFLLGGKEGREESIEERRGERSEEKEI